MPINSGCLVLSIHRVSGRRKEGFVSEVSQKDPLFLKKGPVLVEPYMATFVLSKIIGGPKAGVLGTCVPFLSPISFIFMQFVAKILLYNRFLPQTKGLAPHPV